MIELFVGAGAAEKSLIDNLGFWSTSTESVEATIPDQGILPVEMNIPAGSRLSAQEDISFNRGLVLYGFR